MSPRAVLPGGVLRGAVSSRAVLPGAVLLAVVLLAGCSQPTSTPGPSSAGPPSKTISVPAPSAAAGVRADAEVIKEIPYAAKSPAQVMHLSLPARTGAAVPLVVVVHGGGFESGDKSDVLFLVNALNARGYATAAINYRLSGEALFPAAVQDTRTAIKWLRTYAPVHGIDPNQIAIWGLSAGGHLADMAGVTGGLAGVFDDPTVGWAGTSSAVQAVVAWYAPTDFAAMDAQAIDPGGCPGDPELHGPAGSFEARWLGGALATIPGTVDAATPSGYLSGGSELPPFYLAHGGADCTVPFAQTLEFAAALRAAGADVTVDIVDGAGHAEPAIDRSQIQPSIAFLDRIFGRMN